MLSPRWWGLHAFAILVIVFMVFMGRWQWSVAVRHHNDLRNYAYALQWWIFTLFGLLMWWRIIRDGEAERNTTVPEIRESAEPVAYVGYQASVRDYVDDEDDPEVRAYNEYLASLNKQQEETQ